MRRRQMLQTAAAVIAGAVLPLPAGAAVTSDIIDTGPFEFVHLFAHVVRINETPVLSIDANRFLYVELDSDWRIVDVAVYLAPYETPFPLAGDRIGTQMGRRLDDPVFRELMERAAKFDFAKSAPGSNAGHDSQSRANVSVVWKHR